MEKNQHHDLVFTRLKKTLKSHEPQLSVQTDSSTNYYLNSRKPDAKGKTLFFGAVQLRKSYVSYHLFPVYLFPDLLIDISPELKKRMQGKSCFNFKDIDEDLFAELDAVTKNSFLRFKLKISFSVCMVSKPELQNHNVMA